MQFLDRLFNKETFVLVNKGIRLNKQLTSVDNIFNIDAPIISKGDQNEIFSLTIDKKQYFVKRYFKSRGILSWLGFSRFRIEARNQLWFNQSNLPSAKVCAYAEKRFLLKTKQAVLITEGVNNTQDLAYIAKHSPELFDNKHWRQQLILQCASIMRFFHHHRFCHNDFHWRNILIQQTKTTSTLQVYLIDCPFGRKLFWPLLNYKKFKDLANLDKYAHLYLSRTQRLRFFMAYRQSKKLSHDDKTMIRSILQHKSNRVKRKKKESMRKQRSG